MSRAIGPILTTGVALAAAGVVVANPIAVAPRADIQIPAVALSSGSDEMAGMLDEAFLDAIAPEPANFNPFAVIKDLITALAADATYRGTNAIVEAFVAGVAVISDPELTAAWRPYIPPPADLPVLAMTLLPGLDLSADGVTPVPAPPAVLPDPQPFIDETVLPAVQDLVSTLAADVTFVGREAIAAAFAAGAVVAAEPVMIYKTLRSLVLGDFRGALTNAVKVVTAPLGPPLMIVDAMRTVVERHLAAMTAGLVPAVREPQTAPEVLDAETRPAAPAQQPRSTRPAAPQTRPADPPTTTGEGAVIPAPAAAEAPAMVQAEPEATTGDEAAVTLADTVDAAVVETVDAAVAETVDAAVVETVDAAVAEAVDAAVAEAVDAAVVEADVAGAAVAETRVAEPGVVEPVAGVADAARDEAGAEDRTGPPRGADGA